MSLNTLHYKDEDGILSCVRKEIINFAIEIEKMMKQNDISKKDSWKILDLKELYKKREDHDVDWFDVRIEYSNEQIKEILLDQSIYNMMILNRVHEEEIQDSRPDSNPESYF